MPRGTNLTELIQMFRAEAGHSTSVAAGIDNEAAIIQKLRRSQQMLYDEYDWPFLREEWKIVLQAGERYYDLPTAITYPGQGALNTERIEEAWIDYSGRPITIERGIGQPQYAQYNSDEGTRAGPARRWDIKRPDASKEQIEMWPIPVDNTNKFWLRGIRALRPLVAAGDVCDIDDLAIVLTAVAEILARQKAADAPKVEAAAAARLKQMKARVQGASRMITMSGSSASGYNKNRGKTIVRIGSQSN